MDLKQIMGLVEGITEEQAKAIEKASKEELKEFIPKTRFDEVNNAKKQLEKESKEKDKQLEDIKNSVKDNDELNKKISELQELNRQEKEKYDSEVKQLKLSNTIKLALSDSAQDTDLVASLIDTNKLIMGEDGNVTGLTEQIETLKKEKAFLFKQEEPKKKVKLLLGTQQNQKPQRVKG
jgi:Phage minor structural protein GP20.